MARRTPVIAVALALLLASCAPTREALVLDTQAVPVDQLLSIVRNGEPPAVPFSGEGSLSFDAPETGGSVFFSVAMQRPDSLRVTFEGPFGIDVGFLFADRHHFVLYNALENWYFNEPIQGGGIRSMLPFDLSFSQLMDAFSGTFRLPAEGRPVEYRIDDGMFRLAFLRGQDTASYWIDPTFRVAARYRLTRGDSVLVEATADRWTEKDGVLFPRSIGMTFPPASSGVSVFYSSIVMNPESPSFSHAIPAHARRRLLQ